MSISRTVLFRMINGTLLLSLIMLGAFLVGRSWGRRSSPPSKDSEAEIEAEAVRLPAHPMREISVARVGVRPVSFDERPRQPPGVREAWSVDGTEPRDWERLPASPGMDMTETSHDYVLLFSLPGIRPEDVRLSVTNRVITVQAKIRDPHGIEIGGLLRRVQLPCPTIGSAPVATSFSNGILRICIGK